VTASAGTDLLALERLDFLEAVTGHRPSAATADAIVELRTRAWEQATREG